MGVNYLLDTHTFVWLVGRSDRVDSRVRRILADHHSSVLVSAVSAWEVGTKQRLGKLDEPALAATWRQRVLDIGAQAIDITTEDALLASSFPWSHRDPFDRMLVSQSLNRGATLVTIDREILRLREVRTLTW